MNVIEMSDEEYEQFDPTAKLVKDCPCSFCGRKSTLRFRMPILIDTLYCIAFCPDHIHHVRKLTDRMADVMKNPELILALLPEHTAWSVKL